MLIYENFQLAFLIRGELALGMEQLAQSRAGKKKSNDLNADLAELSVKVLKAKVDSSGGQTFLNNFTTTPDTDEDAAETRTLLARSNSADEEVDR